MAGKGDIKGVDKCHACGVEVKDNESGVGCDGCKCWFHTSCVHISKVLYSAIGKLGEKKEMGELYWFCAACNVNVKRWVTGMQDVKLENEKFRDDLERVKKESKSMGKEVMNIGKDVESVKKLFDEIKNEIEDFKKDKTVLQDVKKDNKSLEKEVRIIGKDVEVVKTRFGEMKNEIEEFKKDKSVLQDVKSAVENLKIDKIEVKKSFVEIMQEEKVKELELSKKDAGGEDRRIKMEVAEAMERSKRRDKIIIKGITEEGSPSEEKDKLDEILKVLIPEREVEYTNMGRIGIKRGSIVRPIRLLVSDDGHRRMMLTRGSRLRDKAGLERVYVCPDLTASQQEDDRKLRKEVREIRQEGLFRVRIVKGLIVKDDFRRAANMSGGISPRLVAGKAAASEENGDEGESSTVKH